LRNPKPAPTVRQHFRHERQLIERSRVIKGLRDLARILHFYQIAWPKF
jgi:hypothetical protein